VCIRWAVWSQLGIRDLADMGEVRGARLAVRYGVAAADVTTRVRDGGRQVRTITLAADYLADLLATPTLPGEGDDAT
jgi:hypothetical protein